MRRLARFGPALIAGVACVAAPSGPAGTAPSAAVLQLSQSAASPGTVIHLQGAGFRVAEYVEIRVTDSAGGQASIGRVVADGRGDMQADVAPGQTVNNGVSLINANGTVSERTASALINVTGGSDGEPMTGQPQWTMRTSGGATCEPCLLVHGQAP